MSSKEIRKLCKDLQVQGFEVRVSRRGHLLVRREGAFITGLPGTPSDHRSIKNGMAALRRAGFVRT